jgi:hypothetical protein
MSPRRFFTAAVLLAAVSAAFLSVSSSDEADAIDINDMSYTLYVGQTYNELIPTNKSPVPNVTYIGSLPPGMSVATTGSGVSTLYYLQGSPTQAGTYDYKIHQSTISGYNDYNLHITVLTPVRYYTVTYDASPGLVNGQSKWTEQIMEGTYASLPAGYYSNGSQTFIGWYDVVSGGQSLTSYIVTKDVTLYGRFMQNSVDITYWAPTIPHGQTQSWPIAVTPSSASLTVGSFPAGWSASLSGSSGSYVLSITVPDGATPGVSYVTLRGTASGWTSSTRSLPVTVPIYVVPPIEDSQAAGTTYVYEPVTNPNNATVSITEVRYNGAAQSNSGFSVSGRSITGPLSSVGTYEIYYRVSAAGYTSSDGVVRVYAFDPPAQYDPPSISGIEAAPRPSEPRTWDFVAVNPSGYASISWSLGGSVFQTGSATSVIEFPTAGFYDVSCVLTGFDGGAVSSVKTVAVADAYHPELAWAGVPYCALFQGASSADVSGAEWLETTMRNVGGVYYLAVFGTPGQSHVGSSFSYTVGSESRAVRVFASAQSPPHAAFEVELSEDGFTLSVDWTGSGASVVYMDYGDGSPVTESMSHVYSSEGFWTVAATAVNDKGERIASHIVFTGGYENGSRSLSLDELTDVTVRQGEKFLIPLTLGDGDFAALLGSATSFVSLEEGYLISGDASGVDPGAYSLTVTVTPASGSPAQATITVTVLPAEDPVPPEPFKVDLWVLIGVFLLVALLFLALGSRARSKRRRAARYGGRRHV